MLIEQSLGKFIPVVKTLHGVVQTGLVVTVFGTMLYFLKLWLSRRTRINDPDPTYFKRQFEKFFNTAFAPIGEHAAATTNTPLRRQFVYHISIGTGVITGALLLYLLIAGMVIGKILVTNEATVLGSSPGIFFQTAVSFITFSAAALMFHAQERAKALAHNSAIS